MSEYYLCLVGMDMALGIRAVCYDTVAQIKFDWSNGVGNNVCGSSLDRCVCLQMCLGVCIFWSYKTQLGRAQTKFSVGTRRIPICVFGIAA